MLLVELITYNIIITSVCVCVWVTDQLDLVQKKAFTKWVNSHLAKVGRHARLLSLHLLMHSFVL